MLARRLTTVLPAMSLAEAIATTRLHRVAGLTGARTTLVTTHPCRAPHNTISDVGLMPPLGSCHESLPLRVGAPQKRYACLVLKLELLTSLWPPLSTSPTPAAGSHRPCARNGPSVTPSQAGFRMTTIAHDYGDERVSATAEGREVIRAASTREVCPTENLKRQCEI